MVQEMSHDVTNCFSAIRLLFQWVEERGTLITPIVQWTMLLMIQELIKNAAITPE